MSISGFFVTGTDTEVGKTYVSAALIGLLRKRGRNPVVFKPMESGVKDFSVHNPSDAQILCHASQVAKKSQNDPSPGVCAYHFDEPLAPAMAAEKTQTKIDLSKIDRMFDAITANPQPKSFTLVEGCGGLMVPLSMTPEPFLVEDLVLRLNLAVLIIAHAGLGTLNHTLLTLSRCQSRGIQVLGVILNETQNLGTPDPSRNENAAYLNRLAGIPVYGPLVFHAKETPFPHENGLHPQHEKALNAFLDDQAL